MVRYLLSSKFLAFSQKLWSLMIKCLLFKVKSNSICCKIFITRFSFQNSDTFEFLTISLDYYFWCTKKPWGLIDKYLVSWWWAPKNCFFFLTFSFDFLLISDKVIDMRILNQSFTQNSHFFCGLFGYKGYSPFLK